MAGPVDSELQRAAYIAHIRKLIKQHGVCETARRVGRTHASISMIKSGRRHARTGALTINSLGLKKVREEKLCRRCGNPAYLFTVSLVCVECELLELEKKELITIEGMEQHNGKPTD